MFTFNHAKLLFDLYKNYDRGVEILISKEICLNKQYFIDWTEGYRLVLLTNLTVNWYNILISSWQWLIWSHSSWLWCHIKQASVTSYGLSVANAIITLCKLFVLDIFQYIKSRCGLWLLMYADLCAYVVLSLSRAGWIFYMHLFT